MRISSQLLDALRKTEIQDAAEYEAMAVCRGGIPATNHGSILYRLREPRRAQASSGEAFGRFGDTTIGGLQLSYILERFGTDITFPETYPLSICIMTVLEGAVHYRPFGPEPATTTTAGGYCWPERCLVHTRLPATEPNGSTFG